MKRMRECDTFWKVTYVQGNDWGEEPYETYKICYTEEELQHCLKWLDYYVYDIRVEKVTRYEFNK